MPVRADGWQPIDAEGYEVICRRVVWYVEIGVCDGDGVGLWKKTTESVPVKNKFAAEELRDQWLTKGKLQLMRWGEIRPKTSYGIFRIRRSEEVVPLPAPPKETE